MLLVCLFGGVLLSSSLISFLCDYLLVLLACLNNFSVVLYFLSFGYVWFGLGLLIRVVRVLSWLSVCFFISVYVSFVCCSLFVCFCLLGC